MKQTLQSSEQSGVLSAPATDEKVLLLGLGNDILTDDAIGLRVVRALAPELANDRAIDVLETTEMGLALLDFLTGYQSAIVIDSIQTGRAPPGTVHLLGAGEIQRLSVHTPHFLGLGETLALGSHLGLQMPDTVRVVGIEVQDPFTLGAELTPPLRAAFPRIVEQVRSELRLVRASKVSSSRQ